MRVQESFQVRNRIGLFRPVGECNLAEAVELVKSAIARCRHQALPGLLVSARGLHGPSIPTLIDRFLAVEEWAEKADGRVAVALVVHPKYIHPQKFGVRVAADFGLTTDVFTSEVNASAWLAQEV
jgi:hypothetical protein